MTLPSASGVSAASITTLPNELLEEIFFHLTPFDLKCCSLVSRRFLAIMRQSRSLSVPILLVLSNQQPRHKVDPCKGSYPIHVTHRTLDPFLHLLKTGPFGFGSNAIGKLALNVRFHCVEEPSYSIRTIFSKLVPRPKSKEWEIEASKLVEILAILSQLRELTLNVYWSQFWEELIKRIGISRALPQREFLPCLRRLEITAKEGQAIQQFVSLTHDQLEELHCTMTEFHSGSFDQLDFSNIAPLFSLRLTLEIKLDNETALRVASHFVSSLSRILSTIPTPSTSTEATATLKDPIKPLKLLTISIAAEPSQMLLLTDANNIHRLSAGPVSDPITFWRPLDEILCKLSGPCNAENAVGIERVHIIYPMQYDNIIYFEKWIEWRNWLVECKDNERIVHRFR